jgi:hypothetical protein
LTPQQEALKRAQARRAALITEARQKCERFVEYAFRHERDGRKLRNASFHDEWHQLLRENDRVVLQAPVEHAKTQHIGIAKPLHLLGNDPNRRIAIISNTEAMAGKILRSIRQHIEENPLVRDVFPHLTRSTDPADPWHTSAITVERTTISKDPSVQACGVYGPLVGSRLDVIILDDVLDFENTRTHEQRVKLIEWFETTVLTRATADCKIYVVGTPWHPEDLLHALSSRPGFTARQYSAALNPDAPPDKWQTLWKEEWPHSRLMDRFQNTSEAVFLRKYLCRTRVDTSGRFRQAWIDKMISYGRGRTMYREAPLAQGGVRRFPTFTGVDLGVGQGIDNALTVIFTIAIDDRGRRIVCEVKSGRWTAPEIIERLIDTRQRFGSEVGVEDNGAQRFLVQMAGERLPVQGLTTTGYNKHHEQFGVESLAVEIRNGWWIAPSGKLGQEVDPEVEAWIRDMLHYSPEAHTGDHLMAAWIAREMSRKFGSPRTLRAPVQNR